MSFLTGQDQPLQFAGLTISKKDGLLLINKKNSTFKCVKNSVSGKENVQFPDSLDFEDLPDF